MRQAEVNNAAAEVSTTFQATPRRRGPSPTLNLGFTARLAWAIAMLLHISIRYQYWCLCCRRAATYRHCSIASLTGAQDRATHFALHPNEPGKGRPAPVTSQQLPDRAGPRATPRRRKSPQRHSRATAALGALALASATSAAFAAATPPPAALISQISAGRLDITLAVHDGFKLRHVHNGKHWKLHPRPHRHHDRDNEFSKYWRHRHEQQQFQGHRRTFDHQPKQRCRQPADRLRNR